VKPLSYVQVCVRSSPRATKGAVLSLCNDAAETSRLQSAFGARLTTFASPELLLDASRGPGVELVILPWRDRGGGSLVATVAAIRASRRSAPVAIYADRSAECLHALVALSRAGATGAIVRDVDDEVIRLQRLIDRDCLTRAREVVTHAVERVAHHRHLPLFLLCLERIDDPPDAAEYARRLHVSRRTLSEWARRAGANGVRSLTARCRVLVAIELIRESGGTLEQVAHQLNFASAAHLHNTVRRYCQCPPGRAAEHDAAHWCQVLFRSAPTRASPIPRRLPEKVVLPPRNGPFHLATQHSPHVAGLVPGEPMQ
jgi:AraC-like DNA-binding protein